MHNLYLDIETIPVQDQGAKDDLAKPFRETAALRAAAIDQEIAHLAPPRNLKDPAKIAAWEAEERPRKTGALKAEKEALEQDWKTKFEEAWRRTSFDGALCHIVAIGWALDDQKPRVLHSGEGWPSLLAEMKLLKQFFAAFSEIPSERQVTTRWIGHNVVDFDLRVIYQRAVVHGVRPPLTIPFESKPWGDRVYDTMAAWCGGRSRVSLDKLCRVLGIAPKGAELGDEIDGSKVWDFVKAGKLADVAIYCGGDVERVREVHQRMTFGGGIVSLEQAA